MDFKPYVCECCGGRIDLAKMKCEYCDTSYHNESLERAKLENDLIRAKTQNLKDQADMETLYTDAIAAMRRYRDIGFRRHT